MTFLTEYVSALLDSWPRKIAALILAALTAVGIALSPLVGLAVFLAGLVVAQAAYAHDRWGTGPKLSVEAEVTRPRQIVNPVNGQHFGAGRFFILNLRNDGSEEARNLHCELAFRAPDGSPLFDETFTARWANTPQPSVTGPFTTIGRALLEMDIPPNSRAEGIDVFLRVADAAPHQRGYVWTNQSMLDGVIIDRYRIEEDEFDVIATIRGSNTASLVAAWRIQSLTIPQYERIDPPT